MSNSAKYVLVILFGMFHLTAFSETVDVTLTGKISSKVTARVKRPNNLFVTDDKGTWFDGGLKMEQLGGWDTPYEVQARLKVVSTTGVFQVRLDSPLAITHQSNPAMVFRTPVVKLGAESGTLIPLVVGSNIEFRNPAAPAPDVDSVGYYSLAVSAYPPVGDFKSTTGTYSGVLSMTFEPLIKAP